MTLFKRTHFRAGKLTLQPRHVLAVSILIRIFREVAMAILFILLRTACLKRRCSGNFVLKQAKCSRSAFGGPQLTEVDRSLLLASKPVPRTAHSCKRFKWRKRCVSKPRVPLGETLKRAGRRDWFEQCGSFGTGVGLCLYSWAKSGNRCYRLLQGGVRQYGCLCD